MKIAAVLLSLILALGACATAYAYWPFLNRLPEQIEPYQDVRGMNLSNFKSTELKTYIETFKFNQDTVWPKDVLELPLNPSLLMETAKNPGLGVRDLHREGITGEGVNVAIIDQPLILNHPEFSGKITVYKNFATGEGSDTSMHGPAVASLLAGTNTGTAPGAKLYYAAIPTWLDDSKYFADALNWIVEENRKLPAGKKIRVVSVSGAPSGYAGYGLPFTKNNHIWDESCEAADKEGILVMDCSSTKRGFIGPCSYDIRDIDNPAACIAGFPGILPAAIYDSYIYTPTSPRTEAEEYKDGEFCYQYTGRGGLSWGIPYVAGVLAMGWQVYPEMTKEQAVDLLRQSASATVQKLASGGTALCKIINPKEFIRLVSEAKTQANGR